MNCLSCVIVVIVGIIIVSSSVDSPPVHRFDHKLYILHIYAHMPLVYAHALVSEYNLYFFNGSHFS